MQGSLTEISLVDLIQINCLERKRARLSLRSDEREAVLFFDEGEIVHVQAGAIEGRDALFDVLTWSEGTFEMINGIAPPTRSLDDTWSGLLLEAMRQIDEGNRDRAEEQRRQAGPPSTPAAVDGPSPPVARAAVPAVPAVPIGAPRARGLVERLRAIQGIEGALVVSPDGTVLAHEIGEDPERLGAVAAFLTGTARRLGEAFSLNRFCRGVVVLPEGRYMVVELPDGLCAGLLLDDRAAPDLLRPALERAVEEPPAPKGARPTLEGVLR